MSKVKNISVKDFLELQKKEKVKLIDIRTTGEHNRECIDCLRIFLLMKYMMLTSSLMRLLYFTVSLVIELIKQLLK